MDSVTNIGRNVTYLNQVNSTNTYVIDAIEEGVLKEGDVVYTYNQTSGKGQRGNKWLSAVGENILFSIYLKPHFLKPYEQYYLNALISLAIKSYLEAKKIALVDVKWPNDVYVGGKKIAGILTECTIRQSRIEQAVVGVGLNVNQVCFGGLAKATSMKLELNISFELMQELTELLSYVSVQYVKLQTNMSGLRQDYIYSLHLLNKWSSFAYNGEQICAKIVGLSQQGFLRLLKENGSYIEADLKQIKFL